MTTADFNSSSTGTTTSTITTTIKIKLKKKIMRRFYIILLLVLMIDCHGPNPILEAFIVNRICNVVVEILFKTQKGIETLT